LLDEVALAEILASDTNLACRHLTDNNPEFVHAYETSNARFTIDLDTPGDLQVLAERTGWRLEMPLQEADEPIFGSQTPVALSSH
jgi:hypothetical protein